MNTISQMVSAAEEKAGGWSNLAAMMPGAKPHMPRDWAKRDSVPTGWILAFCNACSDLGIEGVTADRIVEIKALPEHRLGTPDDEAA